VIVDSPPQGCQTATGLGDLLHDHQFLFPLVIVSLQSADAGNVSATKGVAPPPSGSPFSQESRQAVGSSPSIFNQFD
jgi:hypothetical protein